MKALLLTNEYPPCIYGGVGVHIDYLSRELAKIMEVEVRSFGDQETDLPNLIVRGFGVNTAIFSCPKNLNSVFGAIPAVYLFQHGWRRCRRRPLSHLVYTFWCDSRQG